MQAGVKSSLLSMVFVGGMKAIAASAEVSVLYEENFDNTKLIYDSASGGYKEPNNRAAYVPAAPGAKVAIVSDEVANSSRGKSIRGIYPNPGSEGFYGIWAGFNDIPDGVNELYIEFDARMPKAKHGCKFLKIFGGRGGADYANTTFGLDYTGVDFGSMYFVAFGDGRDTGNDTSNLILLAENAPQTVGRSYPATAKLTYPTDRRAFSSKDWGQDWHHFRFKLKFNSVLPDGTEKADGEYYVEIDDRIYVNATGLFNRHKLNGTIDHLEFFGWTQSGSNNAALVQAGSFELWYDNIVVSTGGFKSVIPKVEGLTHRKM